jgi:Ca2+-binding EF-hand superfamily protein
LNKGRAKGIPFKKKMEKFFSENAQKLRDLIKKSKITKEDFAVLIESFKRLDLDGNNTIEASEFTHFEEIRDNPLLSRVIIKLDRNKDGVIDFAEFCQELTVFAGLSSRSEKIKYLFHLCNLNDDNYLNKEELSGVCSLIFADRLTKKQIDDLCEGCIGRYDEDWDERLSFEEFENAVSTFDIDSILRVSEDEIEEPTPNIGD